MPYYKRKDVLFQAYQLTWNNWAVICDFVPFKDFVGGCYVNEEGMTNDTAGRLALKLRCHNLLGITVAVENDWLIKDGDGMRVCDPEKFEMEYERA